MTHLYRVKNWLDQHLGMLPLSVFSGRQGAATPVMLGVMLLASVLWLAAILPPAINMEEGVAAVEPAAETTIVTRVMERLNAHRRLGDADVALYGEIFAAQREGQFARADAAIARLSDRRLMGYVLAERYLHENVTASYAALADWLRHYNDNAIGPRIHALAQRRQPSGAKTPRAPQLSRGIDGYQDFDVGQLAQPYLKTRKLNPAERDTVKLVQGHLADRPTAALRALERAHAKGQFENAEFDALRGDIAESFFYNAKPEKAYGLAAASADRSKLDVPKAAWIAGLSAWKLGQPAKAAGYFEMAASSKRASVWMTAAAAHWAARAHLRAGNPEEVGEWLARSAQHPRTFYGIISLKMLGEEQDSFSWEMPSFGDRHARALSAVPQGRRALALVDVGRADLAEQELSRLAPGKDEDLQQAMIALANEAGMPGLALRMGSSFKNDDGDLYDAALYPDSVWTPNDGFEVDKALVHAFIRQESKFNPLARNGRSGATGLMQIMPATAEHIAAQMDGELPTGKLKDPVVNIDLGQRYLAELLAHPAVNGNLFKLAVAYNAGPGKLARWSEQASFEDDPLYFIEAIPAAETRIFVERVMTNYWVYRLKYDQDTDSLDHVAEGGWPIYMAQDIRAGSRFAAARLLAAE